MYEKLKPWSPGSGPKPEKVSKPIMFALNHCATLKKQVGAICFIK